MPNNGNKRGSYKKRDKPAKINLPSPTDGRIDGGGGVEGAKISYYRYFMLTVRGMPGTIHDNFDRVRDDTNELLEEIRTTYKFRKIWYTIEKSYPFKKQCHELLCYDNFHAHITIETYPKQKFEIVKTCNLIQSKFNFPINFVCNLPYYGELYIEYVHKDDPYSEVSFLGQPWKCEFMNLEFPEQPDDKKWIDICKGFPDSARNYKDEENVEVDYKLMSKLDRNIFARRIIINHRRMYPEIIVGDHIYRHLQTITELSNELFMVQAELYELLH